MSKSRVKSEDSVAESWRSVDICGVQHNIVLKPDIEMPDVLGLCHSDIQQIWLRGSNTNETMTNILLHECIHAIDHTYHLNMNERQVAVLATALIAFARANPKVSAQLFSLPTQGDAA